MKLTQSRSFALLLGAAFLLAVFVPLSAEAASAKPSCAVTVTTGEGSAKITKTGDIIVREGDSVAVAWEAKNSTAARYNGAKVALTGSQTHTPVRTTTYIFEASTGSRKAACKVTAHLASASADKITSGSKPTLSGEAGGTKRVNVAIYKKGTSKAAYEKKSASVKSGKWEVKVSKTLADGDYSVVISGDSNYELNELGKASLTIGTKNTISNGNSKGSLTVTTLPLLSGGTTTRSGNVPIVYLQLRNTGTEPVHVTGFNVKQNGTASASVISNLSTVDDKGSLRSVSEASPFKNGVALAPTNATIAPGTLKLFTIKAQLGTNVTVGTNLMLDVTGVESNGSEKGAFPLRGTTWVIGN